MLDHFYSDCSTCAVCHENIFKGFSDETIHALNEVKKCHALKKGDFLFREGELPKGLYLIFKGSLKISKYDYDGKELIVRLAKRGDFVGYRALMCNDRYQATACALEETYCCFISKEVYLPLLMSHPENISHVMSRLTRDLLSAENKMMDMVSKNVTGRVAEILLLLEDFYGTSEKQETIKSALKKEDIAHLVGTSTESAIRIMSDFKKKGIIDMVGKKIRIVDRDKLLELSSRSTH